MLIICTIELSPWPLHLPFLYDMIADKLRNQLIVILIFSRIPNSIPNECTARKRSSTLNSTSRIWTEAAEVAEEDAADGVVEKVEEEEIEEEMIAVEEVKEEKDVEEEG